MTITATMPTLPISHNCHNPRYMSKYAANVTSSSNTLTTIPKPTKDTNAPAAYKKQMTPSSTILQPRQKAVLYPTYLLTAAALKTCPTPSTSA
jgi:hypothetical protein